MQFKFKIGDLVVCTYDFSEYFFYPYGEDWLLNVQYGIVVKTRRFNGEWFGYGSAYDILCMDGETRVFYEPEIELVGNIRAGHLPNATE